MTAVYKLVAERRDRNQSMKRKRNNRNLNMFKESIEDVEVVCRNKELRNFRQRTVSEQPPRNTISVPLPKDSSKNQTSAKSQEIIMINLKNQINEMNKKVESLNTTLLAKLNEMSNDILKLKLDSKPN